MLEQVLLFPVPGLMGEYREDFIPVHRIEQRIIQDYPLYLPDAREIGICMLCPSRGIDLKDPAHFQPDFFHNRTYPVLKLLVLNRGKSVKQRLYYKGGNVHHEYSNDKKK